MLPATALAILVAATFGALLPLSLVRAIGLDWSWLELAVGGAGGIAGIALAYIGGDRLNERVRRLRAPIGSASIGGDGFRWRHFGKTEFVKWAVVRDVEQRGANVALHVEGREPVVLLVREAKSFADAAREALVRYHDASAPETIGALEFADESVFDWLGRARALLRRGSYREADVGEEQCVRVAIDPRAPAEQRIGSAAALSRASDDVRNRVRVAIAETADPVIANALEDALEGRDDDAAMRKAMGKR